MWRSWRHSAVACVLLAGVLAAGWAASGTEAPQGSAVERAWSVMPAQTHTATFIDWPRVRAALGDADDTGPVEWRRVASARDLIQQSVLAGSEESIEEAFGWIPRDLAFEAYGQSDDGAVVVMGLSESAAYGVTWERLAASFRETGFRFDDGVWSAGVDEFDASAPGVPGQLRNVAHLRELNVAVAADRPEYVREVLDVASGDEAGFGGLTAVRPVLDPLRDTTAATVRTAAVACEALSLEVLTSEERARVDRAAPLPLETYGAVALGTRDSGDDQIITAAFSFADEAQATRQLRARGDLFTGDALERTVRFDAVVDGPRSAVLGTASVLTFDVGDPMSRAFGELSRGRPPGVACEP